MMRTTEKILYNEAKNDGHTIHLYKRDGLWCAYEISAFLLHLLIKEASANEYVFVRYQVKMPVISITEQDLLLLGRRVNISEEQTNIKIIHCSPASSFIGEAYFLWVKTIAGYLDTTIEC